MRRRREPVEPVSPDSPSGSIRESAHGRHLPYSDGSTLSG